MAKKKRQKAVKQLKRSIRKGEYIVYRDRRGRIRKPRSDLLLVAEVRSRKTGRKIAYLNKVENKRPKPRRFVSNQRAVLETPLTETFERFENYKEEFFFKIYSKDLISNQIPQSLFRQVMEVVRVDGQVQITLEIRTNKGERVTTRGLYIDDSNWRYDDFVHNVTRIILEGINELNIRISPKKFATRRLMRDITRMIECRVGFARLS